VQRVPVITIPMADAVDVDTRVSSWPQSARDLLLGDEKRESMAVVTMLAAK